jgi:hypothetical protein
MKKSITTIEELSRRPIWEPLHTPLWAQYHEWGCEEEEERERKSMPVIHNCSHGFGGECKECEELYGRFYGVDYGVDLDRTNKVEFEIKCKECEIVEKIVKEMCEECGGLYGLCDECPSGLKYGEVDKEDRVEFEIKVDLGILEYCENAKKKNHCGEYCENARKRKCPEGIKAKFPYAEEEK